jgi:hypothetical protein
LIAVRFKEADKFLPGEHPFPTTIQSGRYGPGRVPRRVCAKDLFGLSHGMFHVLAGSPSPGSTCLTGLVCKKNVVFFMQEENRTDATSR